MADSIATDPKRKVIVPPSGFFDPADLLRSLQGQVANGGDPKALRSAAGALLLAAKLAGNTLLAQAFRDSPLSAESLIHSQADLTDRLVTTAWTITTTLLEPEAARALPEPLALVSVGGYGRAEMAPHSDIDLLFLTAKKISPAAEKLVESLLYLLWDLKLKVGHATRTIKDCLTLGREDITIRTALLEHRFVAGMRRWLMDWPIICGQTCSNPPGANSSRRSLPNAVIATNGRAASAMCWNPMSKRARAACATCKPCTGSANTCTGCKTPRGWSGPGFCRRMNLTPLRGPRIFFGRCAATCIMHRGPRGRSADL